MTLQLQIPDSLALRAKELAERESVSVNQIVSVALTAHLDAAPTRPGIAERAKRADLAKFDEILARVAERPPIAGDDW